MTRPYIQQATKTWDEKKGRGRAWKKFEKGWLAIWGDFTK